MSSPVARGKTTRRLVLAILGVVSSPVHAKGGPGCVGRFVVIGGVVMLSHEGTFTDNSGGATRLTETLLHITLDANGDRTGATILGRIADGTARLACDRIPASRGGQAYLAEYRAVLGPATCLRDAREALVARRKSDGVDDSLLSRIDAVEGRGDCDDYDPVQSLEVTPDGTAAFVALSGGIFRIRPSPPLLITADGDAAIFRAHPDGSLLVATVSDEGSTGVLRVYRISPDVVEASGPPLVRDLTPCAAVEVPNDGGYTFFVSLDAGPAETGVFDATLLLNFLVVSGPGAVDSFLLPGGTVAIAAPAGSDTCAVLGLVNARALNLSF
jgi:hypothetical protein